MSTMLWILVIGAAVFIGLGIYLFCATARIFVSENKHGSHVGEENKSPPTTAVKIEEKRSGRDRRKSQTKTRFPYTASDGSLVLRDRRIGERRQAIAI